MQQCCETNVTYVYVMDYTSNVLEENFFAIIKIATQCEAYPDRLILSILHLHSDVPIYIKKENIIT